MTIVPENYLLRAIILMDETHSAQLSVTDHGNLIGMLTREQILHIIRVSSELSI